MMRKRKLRWLMNQSRMTKRRMEISIKKKIWMIW
jgi:hypothetical protein